MNILNEIAEKTRERIEKYKKDMPREVLIREIQQKKVQMLLNPLIQSETAKTPHSFYQALKKPGMSYICEVKKASPSKGLIAPDFPYVAVNFGSVSELFHTAIAPLLSTLLTFVLSAASLFS